MASGKQVSFQFGEVSPLERFRDNDAEYSTALYSLHNMHVKRAGGVSKMPGAKTLWTPGPINVNVPAGNLDYQRYKLFSYPFAIGLANRDLQKFSMRLASDNPAVVTIELYTVSLNVPTVTDTSFSVPVGAGLAGVKAVYADGKVFIHGLYRTLTATPVMVEITELDSAAPVIAPTIGPSLPNFSIPTSAGNVPLAGGVLASGVNYLITYEYRDGTEIPVFRYKDGHALSSGYDANGFMIVPTAADLIFPGEGVLTGFRFNVALLGTLAPKLKNVNVYRSPVSGSSLSGGSFIFVGRMPTDFNSTQNNPVTTYSYTVTFNDTGFSNPLVTPPIDVSMFVDNLGSPLLEGTSCSCVYQGRHIIGFDRFGNVNLKPGNMVASRAGGISQIAGPIINRDIEAFTMSIPISDGSPVRQLISAERVVAFSDNGTYVIQGGDNGILTYSKINPIKLSSEGASPKVSPIKLDNNVVYLNSKHTKLMAIFFDKDYKAGAYEIGQLSEHLFKGDDFIEMNVMPGADNVILLLKQSGELIAVTVNESGAAGFATVNMEGGKVESMTRNGEPNRDALLLSVIRNGVRHWETIGDNALVGDVRAQARSNASSLIGDRQLSPTSLGYPKIGVVSDVVVDPESSTRYEYLNITTATDYLAGSTLTIESVVELGAVVPEIENIKFKVFYETEIDGQTQLEFIYVTLTSAGVFGGATWTYDAVADIDVPAYLQDVEGNVALSAEEILLRTSNWLKAFTKIIAFTGVEYEYGIGALYLMLKDGASVNPVVAPDGEVEVSIVGDGAIYSSPLNYQMPTLKIIKEAAAFPHIILPEPVTFAEVGIPYEAYMQTLPIEVGEGRTITDDKKIVDKVGIGVYDTVGGFIGVPGVSLENMAPIKTRDDADMGNPDLGLTGYVAPILPSKWSREGMIKIIHVDPTPMTILSVYPKGLAGD